MQYPVLVVDKNTDVYHTEQAAWSKHNISSVRVDSMQEAIDRLTKDEFLFVAINGDNINFMPLLKVMSDTSNTLIFIIDSGHTVEREAEAYSTGADAYVVFSGDAEKNVQLALSMLLRYNERGKRPRTLPGMERYGDFLLLHINRKIFLNDEKLKLTRKEYDVLCYFIINHGHSLSYEQVYRQIWDRAVYEYSHKILWNFITKLRKKLRSASGGHDYFTTEWNYGYRFSVTCYKQALH